MPVKFFFYTHFKMAYFFLKFFKLEKEVTQRRVKTGCWIPKREPFLLTSNDWLPDFVIFWLDIPTPNIKANRKLPKLNIVNNRLTGEVFRLTGVLCRITGVLVRLTGVLFRITGG